MPLDNHSGERSDKFKIKLQRIIAVFCAAAFFINTFLDSFGLTERPMSLATQLLLLGTGLMLFETVFKMISELSERK